MRRIDVTFNGKDYVFRSNDSGFALFIGNDVQQVDCETGYQSLSRMKRAIREFLHFRYYLAHETTPPRIKYTPDTISTWEK